MLITSRVSGTCYRMGVRQMGNSYVLPVIFLSKTRIGITYTKNCTLREFVISRKAFRAYTPQELEAWLTDAVTAWELDNKLMALVQPPPAPSTLRELLRSVWRSLQFLLRP